MRQRNVKKERRKEKTIRISPNKRLCVEVRAVETRSGREAKDGRRTYSSSTQRFIPQNRNSFPWSVSSKWGRTWTHYITVSHTIIVPRRYWFQECGKKKINGVVEWACPQSAHSLHREQRKAETRINSSSFCKGRWSSSRQRLLLRASETSSWQWSTWKRPRWFLFLKSFCFQGPVGGFNIEA